LDPLRFPLSFRPRAVKLPAEAWQNLVADRLEDILRNEVAPRFSGERLLSLSGRAEARRMLSDRLFFRLERLGIFVNPADGVTLGNLLPNPVYLKALQEVSAAAAFGEAARERVLPTLDAAALGNGLPTAWDTFVLGAAAAVNREARLGELSINPGSGAVRTPRRPARRRSRPRPAGQPLMQ
jgi:hypothetical protein